MNIENSPDISHLSAEDIIKITEQTNRGQIAREAEALNLMISKLNDVSKVDSVNIRKISELVNARGDSGDCGGGIVCGC
ncbi:MAG: hypothetical protein GY750_08095 [Lentisphaerae bacterium]|nr:hypothetical protein [Lentisphaerota bacterium]MCP4101369.1 hypothetical protein [Lentisphaerota bacterium]